MSTLQPFEADFELLTPGRGAALAYSCFPTACWARPADVELLTGLLLGLTCLLRSYAQSTATQFLPSGEGRLHFWPELPPTRV